VGTENNRKNKGTENKGKKQLKNKIMSYEKQCNGMYLEKYAKNGNLIRTAEYFESGVWVISEYSGSKKAYSGEYSNDEFNSIKGRLFKN
jgi:hypothetical protein